MATIVGKNRMGGRIIEVRVPTEVYDLVRELQEKVNKREMEHHPAANTELRQIWEAKVMPSVRKALGTLEYHKVLDDIWIRPASAVQSLIVKPKRKKLIKPSTAGSGGSRLILPR